MHVQETNGTIAARDYKRKLVYEAQQKKKDFCTKYITPFDAKHIGSSKKCAAIEDEFIKYVIHYMYFVQNIKVDITTLSNTSRFSSPTV